MGYSSDAIRWRLAKGRLHRIYRGVYAVGRAELTQEGRWMAAVLACGPDAYLSHNSNAQLMGMRPRPKPHHRPPIDISLNAAVSELQRESESTAPARSPPKTGAPSTESPARAPIRTLIDLATILPAPQLERAVGDADILDLVDPETLRDALDRHTSAPRRRDRRLALPPHRRPPG